MEGQVAQAPSPGQFSFHEDVLHRCDNKERNMNNRWFCLFVSSLAIGLMALCVGCDGGGAVQDKIAISVYVPASASTDMTSWSWVRVSTTTKTGSCKPYAPLTGGAFLSLPPIEYGQDFQVVVEIYTGLTACEQLVAKGQTSILEIFESDPQTPLFMMVSPVGQFVSTSGALTSGARTEPAVARYGASTTVLPDGRIVIIGGVRLKSGLQDNPLATERAWDVTDNIEEIYDTVEIYDPSTGVFESLDTQEGSAQTLYYRRAFHNAVYLPRFEKIAVVGGLWQATVGSPIQVSNSIELFDPVTRQFSNYQTVGNMTHPRVFSTTDVLDYGVNTSGVPQVFLLIAGGTNDSGNAEEAQKTWEVVRIESGEGAGNIQVYSGIPGDKWQNLWGPRYNHRSVFVKNKSGAGYVYFIGGEDANKTQELIDIFSVGLGELVPPPDGSDAPSGLETSGRVGHSVLFVEAPADSPQHHTIYVVGGFRDKERKETVARIEVIDTENGAQYVSAAQGFNLFKARGHHQVVLMDQGQILVTGGLINDAGTMRMADSSELIGPVYTDFSYTNSIIKAVQTPYPMLTSRFLHNMVYMQNKQALIIGGIRKVDNSVNMIGPSSIEIYPSELYTYDPAPLVSP